MARYEDEYDEYDDEYEDGEYDEVAPPPNWLRETPFWAISAVLHLILIIIIWVVAPDPSAKDPETKTIITMKERRKPPPPYDPEKKRDIKPKPEILNPKKVEKPIIQKKIEEVTTEIPKGTDLDKMSNFNLDASSINAAIGAGGGASGAYGNRFGRGSLVNEGGSEATESAVRAALEWLRRHQDKDGKWSAADYNKHGENRNKDFERYGEDQAFEEHDVGVTALAMLAYTGYGQTHRQGDYPEYVEVLRKAVKWMKAQQISDPSDPTQDGRFGSGDHQEWIYDHAIATMAMAELLVMSNDKLTLRRPVEKAIKLILRSQNDKFGWRYKYRNGENDTSVTGWMVLALKTAKNARLRIPQEDFKRAFGGALNWFDRATATNGKCGYLVPGDEGSRLAKGHPDPYPFSKELSCMTAVSVLCRLFGGETRSDQSIRDGIKILMMEPPEWLEQRGRAKSKINIYYWYYATYALFQFGGNEWREWNEKMQEALISTQRQGNIQEDGSWDPIGEWGIAGGRVYSTALGAMTLEVFYRFERHQEGVTY